LPGIPASFVDSAVSASSRVGGVSEIVMAEKRDVNELAPRGAGLLMRVRQKLGLRRRLWPRSKEDYELAWQAKQWARLFARVEVQAKCREYWRRHRHLDDILARAPLGPDSRILDIGCGISSVLHWLPGRRTGIDPLAESYKGIYAYPEGIEILSGHAESLPYADGSFDAVFCSNCIDHMDSPPDVVAETFRVLRPGGHFVLTCETFRSDEGKRDEGHPHSMTTRKLLELVSQFELLARWESPWYGLRNYALGKPPTEEVENIFLLRRPA
jgi:SAM-dependent methyltransferase